MKIFIRKSSLGEKNPEIVASYGSDQPVNANTHGNDMSMFEIPDGLVSLALLPDETMPRLPEDWRERLTEPAVQAEAKRRIDEALSPIEQITTLHELVEFVLQHGSEIEHWPDSAKRRKADIDKTWDYVRAVKESARTIKSLPATLSHDKHWPERLAKT
jgi:hypothetical protein